MGSPERSRGDERSTGWQHPGDAVDLGGLERLLERHIRQDSRQPPCEHCLARARRADHQQVVRTRGGDLERPLGLFLPPHLGEIDVGAHSLVETLVRVRRGLREDTSSSKERRHLAQRSGTEHAQAIHHSRLREVLRGDDDALETLEACCERYRQRSPNRPHSTLEPQLTDDRVAIE